MLDAIGKRIHDFTAKFSGNSQVSPNTQPIEHSDAETVTEKYEDTQPGGPYEELRLQPRNSDYSQTQSAIAYDEMKPHLKNPERAAYMREWRRQKKAREKYEREEAEGQLRGQVYNSNNNREHKLREGIADEINHARQERDAAKK
jgi:hypothetical protein